MNKSDYQQKIEQWREERESDWRKENGWLALAGLFWLNEGQNRLGRAADNDVVLPAGPNQLGTIVVEEGEVVLKADPTAENVKVAGEPVQEISLKPDVSGSPTLVTAGQLAFIIIKRGDNYAIRLWDNQRPERESFPGRKWFAIDEAYRIPGRYTSHETPETVRLKRSLGEDVDIHAAGEVAFELHGRPLTLLALENEPDNLFLLFKDETSGRETYPAGRYLYAQVEADGNVILDFNRAYSPPCAVTPFATCLYPPRQNHLPLEIRAGEIYKHWENK